MQTKFDPNNCTMFVVYNDLGREVAAYLDDLQAMLCAERLRCSVVMHATFGSCWCRSEVYPISDPPSPFYEDHTNAPHVRRSIEDILERCGGLS